MKKFKTIISMMSGTSADSVDTCLLRIYEDLSFKIMGSYSLKYPQALKEEILRLANNKGDIKDVCFMNFVLGEFFAKAADKLMQKTKITNKDVDFISSHGQTIYHIPEYMEICGIKTKSTFQTGDISVISQRTGIMTIGDFRPKDIAAGGQGAPLVSFADKILFGTDKNRLIQNIGGISNVTVLSKDCEMYAFDNGAGNMLIDYFTKKLFNKEYDRNGELALKGRPDEKWLNELLKEPYYKTAPPKSTGRELFNDNYAEKIYKTAPKNKYDVISTLAALTARTITDSYKDFILNKTKTDEVVLGGGGAYNRAIIKYMKEYMPQIKIKTHEDYNIPNKLKEAVAFAYLGYFAINKKPNNVPSCTGAEMPVIMGKISY